MRLIDADEYKKILQGRVRAVETWDDNIAQVEARAIRACLCQLAVSPTIDAEPVRHGRWLWDGKHHYCSVCSGTRYHDLVLGMDAAYCPYCGAKLVGVEDGRA